MWNDYLDISYSYLNNRSTDLKLVKFDTAANVHCLLYIKPNFMFKVFVRFDYVFTETDISILRQSKACYLQHNPRF